MRLIRTHLFAPINRTTTIVSSSFLKGSIGSFISNGFQVDLFLFNWGFFLPLESTAPGPHRSELPEQRPEEKAVDRRHGGPGPEKLWTQGSLGVCRVTMLFVFRWIYRWCFFESKAILQDPAASNDHSSKVSIGFGAILCHVMTYFHLTPFCMILITFHHKIRVWALGPKQKASCFGGLKRLSFGLKRYMFATNVRHSASKLLVPNQLS